jgi:phosphoglycolate phosphatase
MIGLSLKLVLSELAGPDAPLDEMVDDYHALLPQLRNDVRYAEIPFAGADALLWEPSATPRVTLGIATGHRLDGLKPLMDRFGWQSLFSTIQTSCKAPSKPHPAMVFQAIREAGTTTDDAILIGDTTFDMEMAATAGVRAIGVSWGFHSEHRLRSTGKCEIARDMPELRDIIFNWLR